MPIGRVFINSRLTAAIKTSCDSDGGCVGDGGADNDHDGDGDDDGVLQDVADYCAWTLLQGGSGGEIAQHKTQ